MVDQVVPFLVKISLVGLTFCQVIPIVVFLLSSHIRFSDRRVLIVLVVVISLRCIDDFEQVDLLISASHAMVTDRLGQIVLRGIDLERGRARKRLVIELM